MMHFDASWYYLIQLENHTNSFFSKKTDFMFENDRFDRFARRMHFIINQIKGFHDTIDFSILVYFFKSSCLATKK